MTLYELAKQAVERTAEIKQANGDSDETIMIEAIVEFAKVAGLNLKTGYGIITAWSCAKLIVQACEEIKE